MKTASEFQFSDGRCIMPMRGRILLRRQLPEKMTKGGIHLPDQAQEKQLIATVLAIGYPKKDQDTADVEVGNKVFIGRYAGSELESFGEDIVVVAFEDILAKVS